jgi:hypothetical protein
MLCCSMLVAAAVSLGGLPGRAAPQAKDKDKGEKKRAPAPAPGLDPPERLSPLLRELLHKRMERHGADMSQLVSQVVLLRYDAIVPLSEHIVREPQLARPLPGEMDQLNAQLPSRFFTFQEELRERARQLTDAARARDDKALAGAFGRLTESCVACHAAYRSDPAPATRK